MEVISNIWVLDVQTKIYSKVKAMLTAKLGSVYKDLYITDDDETPSDPMFPSVYIHFLQPSERGQTLDGQCVNAISLTAEVKVTCTKEQGMATCRRVAYEVADIFKSLYFGANFPDFENDGSGTKTMIARYSRLIGFNDII